MSDRHQQPAFPFRPPAELRKRLEQAAEANNRSLNAELISRLESSLTEDDPEAKISENNRMLKALCEKLGVDVASKP